MSIGVIQYLLRFYLIKLIRRADDGERSSFEKQNKFSASTFYSILQQSKRENMQIPVVLRYGRRRTPTMITRISLLHDYFMNMSHV